tara:strand:+ start:273 stop:464 length:192 start_codon:yes stop_codon:yes gene_type:complete
MKIDLEDKNMKVELTQKEIDRLYFTIKDYIKIVNDVDRLNELNISQQEMYKSELELIKKFSKL